MYVSDGRRVNQVGASPATFGTQGLGLQAYEHARQYSRSAQKTNTPSRFNLHECDVPC
jgi:hypothetical protein